MNGRVAVLLRALRLQRDKVAGNARGGFWILDWVGSSQRLSSFIQDTEVGFINENAVAALIGEFAGDADGNKVLHGFTGCWEAHLVLAAWILNKKFCY